MSSRRWRTVPDQKRKLYFFESALTPNVFWVDLRKLDLSAETGKVLKSTSAPIKPTSIPAWRTINSRKRRRSSFSESETQSAPCDLNFKIAICTKCSLPFTALVN